MQESLVSSGTSFALSQAAAGMGGVPTLRNDLTGLPQYKFLQQVEENPYEVYSGITVVSLAHSHKHTHTYTQHLKLCL